MALARTADRHKAGPALHKAHRIRTTHKREDEMGDSDMVVLAALALLSGINGWHGGGSAARREWKGLMVHVAGYISLVVLAAR